MEIQAGGSVHSNTSVPDGSAGSIRITTGGNFAMRMGNDSIGLPSAFISARNTAGSAGSGSGGDVVIISGGVTVDPSSPTNAPTCGAPTGDIVVEPFTSISTDAPGAAGSIQLYAGHNVTISRHPVVGREQHDLRPGGSPITVDTLQRGARHRQRDPQQRQTVGADLVHVQGCSVNIQGLVQSTGDSDEPQGSCPSPCTVKTFNNLCNDPPRPGHQSQTNAAQCLEVWAGSTLKIDATGAHSRELSADTSAGPTGGSGRGWIEIFSTSETSHLLGDSTGPYAVHAIANPRGGTITVKSTDSRSPRRARSCRQLAPDQRHHPADRSSSRPARSRGRQRRLRLRLGQAKGDSMPGPFGSPTQAGGTIQRALLQRKRRRPSSGELNASGGGGGGLLRKVTLEGMRGPQHQQ